MRWVGYATRKREKCMQSSGRKSCRKDTSWKYLGIDKRKLKLILKESSGRAWTGFIWLRLGTTGKQL
jgi:hypothetical protein